MTVKYEGDNFFFMLHPTPTGDVTFHLLLALLPLIKISKAN